MVEPQSAINTFTTVTGIICTGTNAAQKLGQNTHKTILPSNEYLSDVASVTIGVSRCSFVDKNTAADIPKIAPNA